MSKLKEEYGELIEQREKIIGKLKLLEESEIVKEYLELKKQNENLYNKQLSLYKTMKEEEYANCEHILVYSEIEHDRYEGRTHRWCGCIKCGLDDSVLNYNRNWLSFDRQIMYDYLKNHYLRGFETKKTCDLSLAQSIYSKIKESHPDIDDKIAVKYFENALENIRKIKVSDNRKVSRAKRLSLKPDFKRWNGSDVHNG